MGSVRRKSRRCRLKERVDGRKREREVGIKVLPRVKMSLKKTPR